MKVTVLGSGDAFGSGGRNFSAFLLTRGDRHVMVDCGPSALPAFKGTGGDLNQLEGILVSHCHGDHFGGIPYFFIDFQFASARTEPIFVLGPEGLQSRCEALLRATYPDVLQTHPWRFPVSYGELWPGACHGEGDLQVEAFQMEHGSRVPALGYRIRWGEAVVGYTGDTRWNPRIPELARGCDLLLCECFFFHQNQHAHLRYQDLLDHRSEISARRVVLFHLGPEMLQELSRVEMEVAADGMVIDLEG